MRNIEKRVTKPRVSFSLNFRYVFVTGVSKMLCFRYVFVTGVSKSLPTCGRLIFVMFSLHFRYRRFISVMFSLHFRYRRTIFVKKSLRNRYQRHRQTLENFMHAQNFPAFPGVYREKNGGRRFVLVINSFRNQWVFVTFSLPAFHFR